ncbi:cellulase (glycosyl hydrolase family 5) [Paenibacillus taihuensis]|uniref:mannan endo-1,4-beta-mannosidase n=1 Tax=Paenibacillus taihuensis TaxID=1156355 RepID=A0A3D9SIJ1_9BACL|nr:carbohydrate binding domain-containing protein [Paenibacillus taihuensis]REE91708.1 cellulase (glycosyl hydrolase family 5) [Paenibacillus taihuensis]
MIIPRRGLSLIAVLALLFSTLLALLAPAPAQASVTGFVTRSGSQLLLNGQPFRFGSANIYWLGVDENVPPGTIDNPTSFRVDDVFDTAKEMGFNVIRSHAAISFGCAKCIMPTLGNYNEEAFKKLDYAIKSAGDHGIRLILPLIDQYSYYHGGKKTWTVNWFGYPDDGQPYSGYEFFNKREIIDAFKQHLSVLLNRTNTYTGVKYKDDPTIMAWETGNELLWYDNKPAELAWTQEIANYLKSLDANHLIMDGNYGVEDTHLSISSIDIYSDHFYKWPAIGSCCKGLSVSQLNTQATKVANAGKVMYVGEYAWNEEGYGTLASFYSAIESNPVIAGDAPWALFGHSDDYGYVQHNDGYTIHYPGDNAAMSTKTQQMRTHAYAMRGIAVPAHGIPGAPLITGASVSGGLNVLKWRGAVPSATYTVERSTAGASGPWTVICNQCATDNSTPWTDSGIASGTAVWYRVKGHNLSGVTGAYSNVYAISGTTLPAPGSFSQSAPASGAANVGTQPTFSWGASSNAASYTLTVADNSSYSSPVVSASGLTGTSYTSGIQLANSKTYYWKVAAQNGSGTTISSNAGISFTTSAAGGPITIDNFDTYSSDSALQAAYVRNASGGAFTVTRDSATKDAGTYSMKAAYTISASPNYAGVTRTLGTANWSAANGLQLWVKPDGSNRTLTIQFKETNGETWETYYTMSGTTAASLQLPFTSFQHPGWYSGGNGIVDLSSVAELNFYINQGSGGTGSSSIGMDDVKTY